MSEAGDIELDLIAVGAHPDDPGYEVFFEAARDGFEQAIAEKRVCIVPRAPVVSDAYHHRVRQVLVDGPLPQGWTREKTFRTSAWFDGLSSRRRTVAVAFKEQLEISEEGLSSVSSPVSWAYSDIRRVDGGPGILRVSCLSAPSLARLEIRDAAVAAELTYRCAQLGENRLDGRGIAKIVGWSLELRCRAAEATAVIRQAVDEQAILPGTLTLGTDNGSAFTARSTRLAISALGVTHRRGGYRDPESQAFIESWFRYLKERCVWRNEFETLDQAREVIAAYIDHYHDPQPTRRQHTANINRPSRIARQLWNDL